MLNDNQSKRKNLESSLDELLKSSFENDSIELINGRINRTWIRKSIGCGSNWVSQNDHAISSIAEYEKKVRANDGIHLSIKPSPGVKNHETKQLMQRLSKLEQRNAQLIDDNNRIKAKLYEYGWLESDTEYAEQGRLPW